MIIILIWGVRKGCAESLVAMAESVSPIERYSNLVEVFEKLADDQSRWVRSAAYQNLGPFIATFESQHVTPNLLRFATIYNGQSFLLLTGIILEWFPRMQWQLRVHINMEETVIFPPIVRSVSQQYYRQLEAPDGVS